MENLKSEGLCIYCDKMYSSTGITRHLSSHLKKEEKESPTKSKAYHLKITGYKIYFLQVLMNEKLTLDDLDSFLRSIWLECCGHLSSFDIKKKQIRKIANEDRLALLTRMMDAYEDSIDGEDQSVPIGQILKKGMKIDYEYDFGSTTKLEITVMGEYQMKAPKPLFLLSRNEPLKILCTICNKKPAEVMCRVCYDDNFCNSCKDKHVKECSDFAEYSKMEIVNSPRMGVCGYDGGRIDKERDGAWKG